MAVKCKIIKGREVCPKPDLFISGYLGKQPFVEGFSPEALAVFALMDSDPPSALKILMAAFIDSQVLSGNFALLDVFQFYAMDTAANAVINWIGNYSNGLLVNSPTFDAFDGITGDGVTEYITTQYDPSIDSTVGVGQDDIQMGVWVVDNLDAGNNNALFGAIHSGASSAIIIQQQTTPRLLHFMNDLTGENTQAALFLDGKLYTMRRSAGADYDVIVDKVATNVVRASIELLDDDVDVMARDGGLNLNVKVGCFYACIPTGFGHDDFFDNLKIFIDATALLG